MENQFNLSDVYSTIYGRHIILWSSSITYIYIYNMAAIPRVCPVSGCDGRSIIICYCYYIVVVAIKYDCELPRFIFWQVTARRTPGEATEYRCSCRRHYSYILSCRRRCTSDIPIFHTRPTYAHNILYHTSHLTIKCVLYYIITCGCFFFFGLFYITQLCMMLLYIPIRIKVHTSWRYPYYIIL